MVIDSITKAANNLCKNAYLSQSFVIKKMWKTGVRDIYIKYWSTSSISIIYFIQNNADECGWYEQNQMGFIISKSSKDLW